MAYLDWSIKYSVAISEIDEQHKQLIRIINKFYEAGKAKKARSVIDEILEELINYTKYHFQTEEKYFDKFGFEGSERHKIIHKQFERSIIQFKKDNQAGKLLPSKLLFFVKDWIIKHILIEDKKYIDFMHSHGIR